MRLRELGHAARILEGGIQAWREAGAPLITKNPALGVPSADSSRWVTRERPKIDRIACPWLIRRFIDPRAELFYVPTREVFAVAKARGAVAFDIPGGAIEHDGELCSFDTLLRAFDLTEPALLELAVIVRGADTGEAGTDTAVSRPACRVPRALAELSRRSRDAGGGHGAL